LSLGLVTLVEVVCGNASQGGDQGSPIGLPAHNYDMPNKGVVSMCSGILITVVHEVVLRERTF